MQPLLANEEGSSRRSRGGCACCCTCSLVTLAVTAGVVLLGMVIAFGIFWFNEPRAHAELNCPAAKAIGDIKFKAYSPGSGSCPTIGGLTSVTTNKPGASEICFWQNVRYATIDQDHPTGHKTSGTGEAITYGHWGPAVLADVLEPIAPDNGANGLTPSAENTIRCFQMQSETGKKSIPTGQYDCLGLHIFAPPGAADLPVAIFIHGGMYVAGAGDEWAYEGSQLASRGLVIVSINYRLNLYGFSTYDELTRNNGVRDQKVAIDWVHANILQFGGDPEKISIFGESAGATSVAIQALREKNFGGNKIKRMVSESNPLGIILEGPAHKEAIWTKWESGKKGPANCDDTSHCKGGECNTHDHFQCLKDNGAAKTVPAGGGMMMSEIMPSSWGPPLTKVLENFYGYGPCVDGKFIKHQPLNDVQNLAIPTIQGTNREEGGYFAPIIKEALMAMKVDLLDLDKNTGLVSTVMAMFFGPKMYKHYDENEGFRRLTMPFTDYLFSCPMKYVLGSQCGKVYRYQVQSEDACSAPWKKAGDCASVNTDCIGVACHANELPVVFGAWGNDGGCCDGKDGRGHSSIYANYSKMMGDYWYTFFAGGEPWEANGPDNKVKVLGMYGDGGTKDFYGKYEQNADEPDAKDWLFWSTNVCDRMWTVYPVESHP